MYLLFKIFVVEHMTTGAVGLASFWVPVIGRKGAPNHRFWGKVFVICMLATGGFAVAISACTLIAPVETHPHLHGPVFSDPNQIRGIFGWMMIYLAILTINLAWYGWLCIKAKHNRAGLRSPFNLFLQAAVTIAATNCLVQGYRLDQPLMMGISAIGFATAATNLWFIFRATPAPKTWLLEHIKGLVGAGISVYTAFFAFGAVRLAPELALSPALWAAPLVTGLAIIVYHQRNVIRKARAARA